METVQNNFEFGKEEAASYFDVLFSCIAKKYKKILKPGAEIVLHNISPESSDLQNRLNINERQGSIRGGSVLSFALEKRENVTLKNTDFENLPIFCFQYGETSCTNKMCVKNTNHTFFDTPITYQVYSEVPNTKQMEKVIIKSNKTDDLLFYLIYQLAKVCGQRHKHAIISYSFDILNSSAKLIKRDVSSNQENSPSVVFNYLRLDVVMKLTCHIEFSSPIIPPQ